MSEGGSALDGAAGTGPGYHDSRITLPETVSLSFPRTKTSDRTEHAVLSTVQQALRAQLHSVYNASVVSTVSSSSSTSTTANASSADPLLSLYWSAPALTAAQNEIATWVKKDQQPAGVLVITNTSYIAPDTTGKSVVNYCATWAVEAAEKSSVLGTYNTLTLVRADKHHWQVQTLTAKANSAKCAAAAKSGR